LTHAIKLAGLPELGGLYKNMVDEAGQHLQLRKEIQQQLTRQGNRV
jgi:hypothetical protein